MDFLLSLGPTVITIPCAEIEKEQSQEGFRKVCIEHVNRKWNIFSDKSFRSLDSQE